MQHPKHRECLKHQYKKSHWDLYTQLPSDSSNTRYGRSQATRMPLIYTTAKILFELSVLSRRPIIPTQCFWASQAARLAIIHQTKNTQQTLCLKEASDHTQPFHMWLRQRPDCSLPTPQQKYSASFVSSIIRRQNTDTHIWAILAHPECAPTNTTTKILFEFCYTQSYATGM